MEEDFEVDTCLTLINRVALILSPLFIVCLNQQFINEHKR
jgi:CRISPR/Cas system-associated endonuclease/helicase Cas3